MEVKNVKVEGACAKKMTSTIIISKSQIYYLALRNLTCSLREKFIPGIECDKI